MKVVYDWLKEYVGEEMPSVEKLDELFTFHAFEIDGIERVGSHDVIDVKVLPDRSSDCLAHRGIARELATLTGKTLAKDPFVKTAILMPITEKIHVTIENPENCRRFAAAYMTGIRVQESPTWLKERLAALGQRSINNVVDATNYIMLALGQPLHAYDAEALKGQSSVCHLQVRMARAGEEVTTLSDTTLSLTEMVQLIVDGNTDLPLGIAGIKGGKSSGVHDGTTTIVLESANFNPQITRRASQSLRLQTDASKRFENNLSPELVPYGLTSCVKLIEEIAGGECEGYVDVYPTKMMNTPVTVTRAQIQKLLGLSLTRTTIENIFIRLGFTYVKGEDDTWEVTAPFERTDITIPEDIIAEIGRIHGYEHISAITPPLAPLTEYNARHYYSEKIRDILVEEGFSEVITSSFRKKDVIELQNALASDKGYLRSNLHENIREVLDKNIQNLDLLGVTQVQVFEIGTVFLKTPEGDDVTEYVSLAIGVQTKQQHTPKDDIRLLAVQTKLESELGIPFGAAIKSGILECSITDLLSRLSVPTQYEPFVAHNTTFAPYSSYPSISRDVALWVEEGTCAEEIETLLREHAGALLVRLSLFDEFKKDGRISYAFRLVFQSMERTLTAEEVEKIMEGIYETLKTRNFEIR